MSLKILLLGVVLLCAFTSLATARSRKLQNRIVGGHSAVEKQFPYQVSLRYKNDDSHFCGGSIINSHYILSAAHCFTLNAESRSDLIYGVLNKIHTSDHGIRIDVLVLTSHPMFIRLKRSDIALIRTVEPIVFSEFVKPINLPTHGFIEPGTAAVVAGWGFIEVSDCFFSSNFNI